jgi:hypothetical protein
MVDLRGGWGGSGRWGWWVFGSTDLPYQPYLPYPPEKKGDDLSIVAHDRIPNS